MEEVDDGTSNNLVEEEEEERDEEEEDENEEEEGEENQEEEGDEMEYDVRFEGELNPLDIMNNDTSGVQLFQELQRLEYEALFDKNKKRTAPDTPNQGEGSVKRARQEETCGKTFDEMMEEMCSTRKRSRKSKKRGRRKGSRKKLSPEITKKLGDANLHYATGHYEEVKQRRETPSSELRERVRILGEEQTDSLFGNFRRPVPRNDLVKANRAKEKLRKKQTSKEEKKSAALAAGLDWESDDSDNEEPQQPLKEPPLPDLFKDEEHYELISDLCTALTSLWRYGEALEIIKLTLKITDKNLPADKKEKFWSFGAQISLNITDPFDGFDYVRYMVQQCPQSIPSWNCYYKLVLRLENRLSKHNKFLRKIRDALHKDLVPPMIIYGNQYTMISHHQAAAREYLEAYKQMPESPLVNLCVGTALVNLALGHGLQNKHQCVAQGLAFLYNNLRLCENSQESLYNIARALHHVGLFSLAASYYEKVLAINQEDCPFPEVIKEVKDPSERPKPGYCSLRREAAYNLHLIYKRSGAVDLARQVLKDYCTV